MIPDFYSFHKWIFYIKYKASKVVQISDNNKQFFSAIITQMFHEAQPHGKAFNY